VAPEKQRIYSYTVLDRESFTLSLDSQRESEISNSLAFRELFSFEVIPNRALRSNLGEMFQEYEGVIRTNTLRLLQMCSDAASFVIGHTLVVDGGQMV
jgi:hypothetical protein